MRHRNVPGRDNTGRPYIISINMYCLYVGVYFLNCLQVWRTHFNFVWSQEFLCMWHIYSVQCITLVFQILIICRAYMWSLRCRLYVRRLIAVFQILFISKETHIFFSGWWLYVSRLHGIFHYWLLCGDYLVFQIIAVCKQTIRSLSDVDFIQWASI